MKLLKDRLMVKEIVEEVRKSGIILSQKEDKPIIKCEVILIGKDVKEVKVKDIVYVHKYAGDFFEDNIIIFEEEVIGIE